MSPRSIFRIPFHLISISAGLVLAGAGWAVETKTPPSVGALTLEQAYDRALATDQTIRIAYWEIRKSNLLPWSALARIGPQVTASGSYVRSDVATKTTVVESDTTTVVSGIGTPVTRAVDLTARAEARQVALPMPSR